jgi:hypothetical protein
VTKRRVFVAVSGIWLIACCIFAVFMVQYGKHPNRFRSFCYLEDTLSFLMNALISYFPLTIIAILNAWILKVAEKQRNRILVETAATHAFKVNRIFRAHKAVRTFSVVVAVLTFCVLTPTVVGQVIKKVPSCSDSCEQLWFVVFHCEFYGINSIVNAFIYGMRHIKYRRAPRQIILKICRCSTE